jgi:hypothetical protein
VFTRWSGCTKITPSTTETHQMIKLYQNQLDLLREAIHAAEYGNSLHKPNPCMADENDLAVLCSIEALTLVGKDEYEITETAFDYI